MKSHILGVFIILMLLSGCKSDAILDMAPSPTHTLVVEAIATLSPSSTPAPLTTPTPPSVPTATPTEISTIPVTPTPRATLMPTVAPLPDWIMDPNAHVLFLNDSSLASSRTTVFNADSGEMLVVSTQDLLDKMDGKVVNVDDALSPNGRYEVRINSHEEGGSSAAILDHETGAETELFNPFLDYQTLDETFFNYAETAYWSPDGTYLSVLYFKHYYSDNYDLNLVIYTPSGEIFRQYADTETSWRNPWNPVSPHKILYGRGCILDIIENEKNCLAVLDAWSNDKDVLLYHYMWSPDGSKISYIYKEPYESVLSEQGICYIELVTDSIECPVTANDLFLDEQLYIRIQFWSSDSKYIVLFSDEIGFSDVFGVPKVAVVGSDGQNFQFLEGGYTWTGRTNPWRQPISP